MYVCMFVYIICVYARMYVCVYILCVCVCVCVCAYIAHSRHAGAARTQGAIKKASRVGAIKKQSRCHKESTQSSMLE